MLIPSILPHLFMQGNEIILGLGEEGNRPKSSYIKHC